MANTSPVAPQIQSQTFAEFLEASPPDVQEKISDLAVYRGASIAISQCDIQLHCGSEVCGGLRTFRPTDSYSYLSVNWSFKFLNYRCRNCEKTQKTFAVAAHLDADASTSGVALKLGETPPFGPPTPSRVITLIGPDREIFLRGRRAENQGLGIGAFAYYRRVVENQKGRIILEMGKVSQRINPDENTAKLFAEAAKETQFSKAIDLVKSALPNSLLIEGHNPLTLLHAALSEGLHERPDNECLELATSIRVLLTELAERMSQALKDDAELKDSVSRLLNRQNVRAKQEAKRS